jgi:hypothetical protein
MDASGMFPPSPAFSDCDSLAGIDDLDAFLDAQGKLSHWPTPPLKSEIEEDLEVPSEDSDYESEDGVDGMQQMFEDELTCADSFADLDIATVYARELRLDGPQAWDDILLMEELFVRARLPIEVLALSFNILSKLVKQKAIDDLLRNTSLELLILATLSLASIHTNDHPPSPSCFARQVSVTPTTGKQVSEATLAIMTALDWRVHNCSEGATIVSTLRLFERREPPLYAPQSMQDIYDEPFLKPQPLCYNMADRSNAGEAQWANGQLTPGASSTCSAVQEFENSFLPLL